jgi:hypothetical protein
VARGHSITAHAISHTTAQKTEENGHFLKIYLYKTISQFQKNHKTKLVMVLREALRIRIMVRVTVRFHSSEILTFQILLEC